MFLSESYSMMQFSLRVFASDSFPCKLDDYSVLYVQIPNCELLSIYIITLKVALRQLDSRSKWRAFTKRSLINNSLLASPHSPSTCQTPILSHLIIIPILYFYSCFISFAYFAYCLSLNSARSCLCSILGHSSYPSSAKPANSTA